MAEQFDPRLEERLRAALHDEADAVPFTLRPADLERLAARRRTSRRSQRRTLWAAAAVVVMAVVGVAAFTNLRSPAPVTSSRLAALPSFDQLISNAGQGTELLREEADAFTVAGQWQYGLPQGIGSFEIALACTGGPLHVSTSADGAPVQDLGHLEGACDGQALTIGTGAIPRLAAAAAPSVVLDGPAGTAWRMVVLATQTGPSPAGITPPPATPPVDVTNGPGITPAPSPHPSPAVACGPPDLTAKDPPALTLYQGATLLGTGDYYTTMWTTTANDRVPITPTTAIQVASGSNLVLRIAGDVCAMEWSVSYGPLPAGGIGFSPGGTLVYQGNPSFDPAFASENRISLADLPAGDWLLDAFVRFTNGDGAAVFRVHVGG